MANKEDKVSKKAKLFIAEYPKDFNGAQAAIRAGFSAKTAAQAASRLLRNVYIRNAMREATEKRLNKVEIEAERVLTELAHIGFHDIRKIFNENHSLKSPGEWDDATAAAIAGVEVYEEFSGRGNDREHIGQTKKLKIFDKPRALELLGKHLSLFIEKHEHKIEGKIEAQTSVEVDLAQRLVDDEQANRLVHALLTLVGNPGGNGDEAKSGAMGSGKTPNASKSKTG